MGHRGRLVPRRVRHPVSTWRVWMQCACLEPRASLRWPLGWFQVEVPKLEADRRAGTETVTGTGTETGIGTGNGRASKGWYGGSPVVALRKIRDDGCRNQNGRKWQLDPAPKDIKECPWLGRLGTGSSVHSRCPAKVADRLMLILDVFSRRPLGAYRHRLN